MNNTINTNYFKLFSYLSMTVISVAIIVGIIFLYQHHELVANQNAVLLNQKLIQENTQKALENQDLLRKVLNQITEHEGREESLLGNTTSLNLNVSKSNSERLNLILGYLNITIPKSLR